MCVTHARGVKQYMTHSRLIITFTSHKGYNMSKQNTNDTTPMTVAQVAHAIAKIKNTDAKVEAKKLRGYIRANFDTIKNEWGAIDEIGKANRDGNRYPPMSRELADTLIAKRTQTTNKA